jgi:integrase
MYLLIKPSGSKLWQMKYRYAGKERVYSIGAFPEVLLTAARVERDRAREWLRQGKDPTIERRITKANAATQQAITFRLIAEEWLERQKYSERHRRAQRVMLDRDLLPYLGDLPIRQITTQMVLEALRRIERRGALEMAAKARRMVSQIFRYAVHTGQADADPAALLAGALKTADTKHRATVAFGELPQLFEALQAVPAELNTKLGFYWLLLSACRTVEMRFASWAEIDGKLWRVPAQRMKMRRDFIVPMSTQAISILERAREIRAGDGPEALIFPGFSRSGALSENALLALLARAGYFGRQTAHGFRALFSTWAHEVREAHPDVIEACLAHQGDGVRFDYNRAAYLSQRRELLQAWADALEACGMRIP